MVFLFRCLCASALLFGFYILSSVCISFFAYPRFLHLEADKPPAYSNKMAPTKGSNKSDSKKGKPSTLSSASRVSKKKDAKRPPPQEQKAIARTEPRQLKKTKKREYTEEELDLPKLNAITPVGVVKPKGKKKGKTFVDDQVGLV